MAPPAGRPLVIARLRKRTVAPYWPSRGSAASGFRGAARKGTGSHRRPGPFSQGALSEDREYANLVFVIACCSSEV